ncbi:spore coat protein [Brevibacillus fulvus]|uniref:Spore coat protein CotF n=1 Tax=Brevibacillus fulvus TaxID=1125967 RepID=A0A938XYF5_9BACL|nr:spore coat protein [Brevibacillus fulvus]MBM7590141.1 spore coat protein CotF [Brevibacillus fulvus]
MANQPYGAHEIIELHEVLNGTIDAINTLQMYKGFARDPELQQMATVHIRFITDEYNQIVNVVHGLGVPEAIPYRPQTATTQASGPSWYQDKLLMNGLDDRDVTSAMLGCYKSTAQIKFRAALETASLPIRNLLLQAATNAANLAYETWNYMQRRGYYPLVSLSGASSAQLLRGYQPVQNVSPPMFAPIPPGASPIPPAPYSGINGQEHSFDQTLPESFSSVNDVNNLSMGGNAAEEQPEPAARKRTKKAGE